MPNKRERRRKNLRKKNNERTSWRNSCHNIDNGTRSTEVKEKQTKRIVVMIATLTMLWQMGKNKIVSEVVEVVVLIF